MKGFLNQIKYSLSHKDIEADESTIIGSWRLISYQDSQNKEEKPLWKEVWSFAAMDEAETNGVYVCDYINLHIFVGKWVLNGESLRLIRKESEIDFSITELTENRLTINSTNNESLYHRLEFQRVQ